MRSEQVTHDHRARPLTTGPRPGRTTGSPGGVRTIVAEAGGMALGHFRCDAHTEAWRTENVIGPCAVLAFATVPVSIEQRGHGVRTADRSRVMLYNPGQTYRRGLLHEDGDRCVCLSVEPEVAARVMGDSSERGEADPERPFETDHATLPPRAVRLLRETLRGAAGMDELELEERLLTVLAWIPLGGSERADERRPSTVAAHHELAEATLADLALHYARGDSLSEVARRVHSSPFHLARVFRAHTGRSIVAHRRVLRAAEGYHRLLDTHEPVAVIADRVGYPSHASFSADFKRVFGITPTEARESR